MSQIGKIISKRKYDFLKGFSENSLNEVEKKQVEEYEKNSVQSIPKGYFDKKPKPKPITQISTDWLKATFRKKFEDLEKKELVVTEKSIPIYTAVMQYFSKNLEFKKTSVTENIPSLDKGLLLIGGFGCGKTSMMRALQEIGRMIYDKTGSTFMWFRMISCNGLVNEYEGLENAKDKELFIKKYVGGVVYFDDFGTENIASNFGKRNLLKDILEERYMKSNKCHLTSNLSLEEIAEKYGGRVYDRMQEMFNIIVWEGDSFRK